MHQNSLTLQFKIKKPANHWRTLKRSLFDFHPFLFESKFLKSSGGVLKSMGVFDFKRRVWCQTEGTRPVIIVIFRMSIFVKS